MITGDLSPVGYQFRQVVRKGRRGGGVAIVCKEGLQLPNPDTISAKCLNFLDVTISSNSRSFRLALLYHTLPPPSKKSPCTVCMFLQLIRTIIIFIIIIKCLL